MALFVCEYNLFAQISKSFDENLNNYVDSLVKAIEPNLIRENRFDCKSHVLSTKFSFKEIPYSRDIAYFYSVVTFGQDSSGKEFRNPEYYGLSFIKQIYSETITGSIKANKDDLFDCYDFEIVQVNGSYFLVFAMSYLKPLDNIKDLKMSWEKAQSQ